jgi:hypothetical protein
MFRTFTLEKGKLYLGAIAIWATSYFLMILFLKWKVAGDETDALNKIVASLVYIFGGLVSWFVFNLTLLIAGLIISYRRGNDEYVQTIKELIVIFCLIGIMIMIF